MPDPLDIEDPAALLAWLRQNGRIAADETPRLHTLHGGVSNRTVLVERPSGEAWVLKQALAKLRVPVDWFSSPERIHREALALEWLPRLAPSGSITPLVFADRAHHLLAMQAVPQPHENWKQMLLAGRLCPDHVRQFAALLAHIHRAAWQRADLAAVFGDRTFFESLRLEPYYAYSAQQVLSAAAFLDELLAATRACTVTLVHGDYSPKNILVYRDRLVLLDHEVIHFGDPAFDVGFALTHLLSKAHHLPARRPDFLAAAAQFWQVYAAAAGAQYESRAVCHTLACLLARVAGRSPLEYLDPAQRLRQRDAVLRILRAPPANIPDLVARFAEALCP